MDYATILGIGSVLLVVALSLLAGAGGQVGAFVSIPAMLLVLGGALAATVSSTAGKRFRAAWAALRRVLREPGESPEATLQELVRLADAARREGLLLMETRIRPDDERYLARAARMVIDGYDPTTIETVLHDELEATDARHAGTRQFFEALARTCPVFGMIGTLIGLIVMLRSLDDPSQIGPGMAVALLTTLYGLLLANAVFLPIARKLAARSADELLVKTIVIKGVLAIQQGDNPRVVEQKLRAFLPQGTPTIVHRHGPSLEEVLGDDAVLGARETAAA